MEESIQVFKNEEFGNIRTYDEDGKICFCGSDVATALGYAKPRNALAAHTKGALKRGVLTDGGKQDMLFITEGDLYRLIAHSKLPSAEKFESWVFDDVLPTIRKHGAYVTPSKMCEFAANPEAMFFTMSELQKDQMVLNQRIDKLESQLSYKPETPLFMPTITEATLNIRDSAKEIGVPQKKFVAFLEEHHYVTRDAFGHMIPDSKYVKNHYFELRHYNINGIHVPPLLTCKGRKHLMKMMIRNNTKERALAC